MIRYKTAELVCDICEDDVFTVEKNSEGRIVFCGEDYELGTIVSAFVSPAAAREFAKEIVRLCDAADEAAKKQADAKFEMGVKSLVDGFTPRSLTR